MPLAFLDKGREKTTMVFDTWARVGEGVLAITWDVDLEPSAHALLAALVNRLGYLGRSESWVEARLLEAGEPLPPGSAASPVESGRPGEPGWEQVALLAPESPDDYQAWRASAVGEALAGLPLPDGGRKPSAKLLQERAKAEAPLPVDLMACLQVDSSWLQRFGWSQPPGSRRILYWRRCDALEVGPPRALRPTLDASLVEAMLLALSTPTGNLHALPPRGRCLPQAELIHQSLVGSLGRAGPVMAAPELVGRDAERRPLTGHGHAHLLPLDLDEDGHLEHVLIWAPMGLGGAAQEAIRALRRAFTRRQSSDLRVAVAGAGELRVFCGLPGGLGAAMAGLLGPVEGATRWESLTPFVPPRFLKRNGRNTLEGQVQAELACRGFPAAEVEVQAFDAPAAAQWRHFVRVRRTGGPPPPMDVAYGLRLTFPRPVSGPISLGYASHFGLGLFRTRYP